MSLGRVKGRGVTLAHQKQVPEYYCEWAGTLLSGGAHRDGGESSLDCECDLEQQKHKEETLFPSPHNQQPVLPFSS